MDLDQEGLVVEALHLTQEGREEREGLLVVLAAQLKRCQSQLLQHMRNSSDDDNPNLSNSNNNATTKPKDSTKH
jgi:uncharacterized protein YaeQ